MKRSFSSLLALFLLYYLAYRICRDQNGDNQYDYRLWAIVLIGALVLALVNTYVCTTHSLDIYDYIARGRITAFHGRNPYDKTQTPNAYAAVDPFMQYASWKDKTAAYGPLWEVLSGLISYGAGDKLLANMLAHKGLALASYLLCVLIIAVTLRRVSPKRAIAGAFWPMRDIASTSFHNYGVRFSRISLLVVLLAAGLLAAQPGIAEEIESVIPGDDCVEDCSGDTADGGCGTSCDECTCCARILAAVFLPCPGPGKPGRLESASTTIPTRKPLALPEGVYHPPRA